MTLIIAGITNDAIVLSGDSKVTGLDENEVLDLHFRKIYHLKDGIFFGVSANSIDKKELELLSRHMREHFRQLKSPYDVTCVAYRFTRIISAVYANRPSGFSMRIIIAGYSRDVDGSTTTPVIAYVDSDNDWTIKFSSRVAIGDVDRKRFPVSKLPRTTKELVKRTREIIREVEKTQPRVGGDIRTVIIRDMGKKKFKRLIEKANQNHE